MEAASPPSAPPPAKWARTRGAYMRLFGAPNSARLRALPEEQRQALHAYFWWVEYQFFNVLYHQHSYPFMFVRDPPRLRYWMRVLGPITQVFGGTKIVHSNLRYIMFCNLIAMGKGVFWVWPAIAYGRHLITESPNGKEISEYLHNDTFVIGRLLIPFKYRTHKKTEQEGSEDQRAKNYAYLLRRGLPIPPTLMPKNAEEAEEWKRLASTESREVNDGEVMEVKRASPTGFNPRISLNIRPKDMSQPKIAGVEEKPKKESKSWRDWFTASK